MTSPSGRPGSRSQAGSRQDEDSDLGAFGEQLRKLYQDTVQEPIPDEMKDLLDRLEREDGDDDGNRR